MSKNTSKQITRKAKPDALAPYRAQAAIFIRLYFGKDTPAFLRDVLASWYTQLETASQVFWNYREIAEIALPIMLREADRRGIDIESPGSGLCLDALRESLAMRDERGERTPEPSEAQMLQREAQLDAEAIARIIDSPRVPDSIKEKLIDRFFEFTDDHSLAPEVIRAKFLLAVASQTEGSAAQ